MEIQKLLPILGFLLFILLIDWYSFQGIRVAVALDNPARKWIFGVFWGFTGYSIAGFLYFRFLGQAGASRSVMVFAFASFFIIYMSKILFSGFLLGEDLFRGLSWLYQKAIHFGKLKEEPYSFQRSAFLSKVALSIAALPMVSLFYGMLKGAYDYRVRKQKLIFPKLPKAFEGLKIVQISDVHVGSFLDEKAVARGVQMILDLKPDLVVFTGDLVNNEAVEFEPYQALFGKITAPLGVYSILGNHDYGDYKFWSSKEEKEKNLEKLKNMQAEIGWRLLLDEHIPIEKEGDKIALIGVQNWSAKGRFPKYGNLKKAYAGAEHFPVKILLSHDPSHWEGEVLAHFPEIDVMLAGHTHGMQFGVEIPGFRWSPVQYVYKQWAGYYQSGSQQLYVNRGFGFIGYPGRVGIWPEISLLTLHSA